MCWDKEAEYVECYDHVWGIQNPSMMCDPEEIEAELTRIGTHFNLTIAGALEISGNMEFIKEGECMMSFYKLLTTWHDKGWVKPNEARLKELAEKQKKWDEKYNKWAEEQK